MVDSINDDSHSIYDCACVDKRCAERFFKLPARIQSHNRGHEKDPRSNAHSENIDTKLLAEKTEFFSGADIENLCERVAKHVLAEILETGVERQMKMDDFLLMLEQVRPPQWNGCAKRKIIRNMLIRAENTMK